MLELKSYFEKYILHIHVITNVHIESLEQFKIAIKFEKIKFDI